MSTTRSGARLVGHLDSTSLTRSTRHLQHALSCPTPHAVRRAQPPTITGFAALRTPWTTSARTSPFPTPTRSSSPTAKNGDDDPRGAFYEKEEMQTNHDGLHDWLLSENRGEEGSKALDDLDAIERGFQVEADKYGATANKLGHALKWCLAMAPKLVEAQEVALRQEKKSLLAKGRAKIAWFALRVAVKNEADAELLSKYEEEAKKEDAKHEKTLAELKKQLAEKDEEIDRVNAEKQKLLEEKRAESKRANHWAQRFYSMFGLDEKA